MQTWELFIAVFGGGAFTAAIIKIIDNVIMYNLNRKAKIEDTEVLNIKSIEKRVVTLEDKITNDCEHLHAIDIQMEHNSSEMQAVLKALHALLSHSMTGNETGEMKIARDNLVNFIIENK